MGKGYRETKRFDFGVSEGGFKVSDHLKVYVKKLLKSNLKVRCIVVFGSRARGNAESHSDTDVLVIADNFPEDRSEILAVLNPIETWNISLEPRAYYPDEFIRALYSLDLTALDAVNEGIPIYDDGFWGRAKKEFKKVRRIYKLIKIEDGWIAKEPI